MLLPNTSYTIDARIRHHESVTSWLGKVDVSVNGRLVIARDMEFNLQATLVASPVQLFD